MCGIVGKAVHKNALLNFDQATINESLRLIHHRGPDSQGTYLDERVFFGHVRLSILDLSSAASQPMATPDGRYIITYNGEVYNFKELERHYGVTGMRSHSDTEVILNILARHGISAVSSFNGMFAFAFLDKALNKMWLVRDRLGIKPLFYSLNETGLSFASEVKSLLVVNGAAPECQVSSIHEWLYYGTTLGTNTLYKGVHQLLPGHYLEVDLTNFTTCVACYWSPAQYAGGRKHVGTLQGRVQEVRSLLEQAVKRQLVSDVPVGIFLSGGIDSSAITAFASRHYHNGKISTYSVGFDFSKGANELPVAKAIADRFGTNHHELHVTGPDISSVIEKMVYHHDSPFSDAANIPLYLLCSQISGTTKVVLQGDGGDELFGGYSRYSTLSFYGLARFVAKVAGIGRVVAPRNARHYRLSRYINALKPDDLATVMALLLTEEDGGSDLSLLFHDDFRKVLLQSDPFVRYRELQKKVAGEDVVNQMLFVDSMAILPDVFLEKVDRSTMAASVEVRVPFLDNDIVDLCLRLPGQQKVNLGRKKWLLKKALEGIVPDQVLYGRKTGFSVPYGFWLSTSLRGFFFDEVGAFQRNNPALLRTDMINNLFSEHQCGKRDRSFLLWKLLNLAVWANRSGVKVG